MTAIEWTQRTWNPTTGCDRTSPGCDHCYALTLAKRLKAMGQAKYQTDGDPRTSGPGFGVAVHPDALQVPLRVKKPTRWFVNSMSDLFHPDIPDNFIEAVLATMNAAPRHTYQVLTKRPQRMAQVLRRVSWDCNGDLILGRYTADELGVPGHPSYDVAALMPQTWWGTSIETDRYTFRANHLRNTPAAVRFLSLEPLLGPLPSLNLAGIDWVIVGGESGPGARPMHPDWVRDIRDRCTDVGVPFFFKQWGRFAPWVPAESSGGHPYIDQDGTRLAVMGKKAAGRLLDGRTWDEYPSLKVPA